MKSVWLFLLILIYLLSFVLGQFLMKLAVGRPEEAAPARARWYFGVGILSMTVSFFLSIGLLQRLDLSYLFPFQGLSVILITLGAFLFLKERLSLSLLVGALLITVGVMLVSSS